MNVKIIVSLMLLSISGICLTNNRIDKTYQKDLQTVILNHYLKQPNKNKRSTLKINQQKTGSKKRTSAHVWIQHLQKKLDGKN